MNPIAHSSYCGMPVSVETAGKTFCALREDWWKQVFDGKFHIFEKMVFDEGLHGREKEPGFYDSALNAFEYAKNNIGKKVNVDLYCGIHKIVCSHFQGQANNTEMGASEAGTFRNCGTRCRFTVQDCLTFFNHTGLDESLIKEFKLIRQYTGLKTLELCNEAYLTEQREYLRLPTLTPYAMEELERLLQKKMGETDADLSKLRDTQLGKACPKISIMDSLVDIDYASLSPDAFQEVVSHAFSQFNRSIAAIDAELLSDDHRLEELTEQKLILIADLFQKLEWFHPFKDGQGRTDLIFLGMLLSKHGFCPAILNEPYVSSFAPLSDWVNYLKEGMKKWEALAVSVS